MELGDIAGNTPVPVADSHDLRVLLRLLLDTEKRIGGGSIAFDASVLAPLLSPLSNHLAAFLRTALLVSLFRNRLLGDWHSETDLTDAVLEKAAIYPLPGGIDQFNAGDFINFLRSETAP